MQRTNKGEKAYVYGLDIGTRSIVGTVGYREKNRFVVVAQYSREHESRAMLDGQIHDINAVSDTIREVTKVLEQKVGQKLSRVCIAAAGRVLKTVTVHADMELDSERTVSREDIFMLDSLGVEKAYEKFQKEEQQAVKFYCVGYSVMHYYLNGYPMNTLENHKAREIAADMIATFLPDDVVDGLYKAVELSDLEVANLTLEPIAAIELAIPEKYRMLNIALIDVGAGTSDISVTRDGSIIAYGMLPLAGDCLTEDIARHCLVDFHTAEQIKRGIEKQEIVEYKDIMGIGQKISRKEVLSVVEDSLEDLAARASEKVRELNGGKPVSAVFVVGGGGKIATYTERVAEHLGIPKERCAVRGEEVMERIEFAEKDCVKDSLMVTPIGICLNYYEQSNNFIFVTFNEKRIKLYDNNRLAIIDAAISAEFSNDDLFPKRGEALEFSLNGKPMSIRGTRGESASVFLNGKEADIHTAIRSNDVIRVVPSTAGEKAALQVAGLPGYEGSILVHVNGNEITLPRLAGVNGRLQSAYYSLKDGDEVELLNYYSVRQILEFMDMEPESVGQIVVNHEPAVLDTKVYDNFTLTYVPTAGERAVEDGAAAAVTEDHVAAVPAENTTAAENAFLPASGEGRDTSGQSSLLEQAKADAMKVVEKLRFERAEEALSQMVQAAFAGGNAGSGMPVSGAQEKGTAQGAFSSGQLELPKIEKSGKELYNSLQNNLNRLKAGTSVTELRKETLEQEAVLPDPADGKTGGNPAEREAGGNPADGKAGEHPADREKGGAAVPKEGTEVVDGKTLRILHVIVNDELVTLSGKTDYVYVDVFQFIPFDLSKPQGTMVETLINGRKAQYMEPLNNGDQLEIFWKD